MKSILALLCMVAYVYSNSDIHKLPTVRELLGKESQTCEEFISNLENAHCWSKNDPKLGFERTFIYQINDNDMTADDAEDACIAAGGHLMTIADQTELDKLKAVIQLPSDADPFMINYYLGARREEDGKPFENTDKTDLTAFFRSKLPDPLDQNCIGITATNDSATNGEIVNIACDAANTRFICKFIFHKNAKVYISSHHDKSWFNALEQCNMMGGNLATIDHPRESKLYNRLIAERNLHWAWIGLNDLNKERFFEWADHSTSRYRRFCKKPTANDMANDCVKLVARHHKGHSGCMKPDMCFTPFPYICEIRSTACDEHTMTMQGYMTSILKDVYSARRVCRPCKRGPHHVKKETQSKPKTQVIDKPGTISKFLG